MKTPIIFSLAALAVLSVIFTDADARTFTNSSGVQLDADYLGINGDKVKLKRLSDGRTFDIPLATLSADDRAWIAEQGASDSSEAPAAAAGGADWPGWRGAGQSGISPDTGLLKKWPSDGPKLLWSYEDAGMGYSSAAIVGGKYYTLGARDAKEMLICLDANTGEEIWATEIETDPQEGYLTKWGSGPRSTPTVSEGHVYVLGVAGDIVCLTADEGKKVWDKNLVSDFGGEISKWGYSESPTVDGDRVLVTPGGGKGAIVALDKKTGRTIWQSKDLTDKAEYSSVVVADVGGKKQYVQLFMNTLAGVDAESGDLVWRADWERGKTAVIPTPIYRDGHVYMTSGYGAGGMLVNIAGGDAEVVWDNTEMKNHHGGVILHEDHVYGFSDGAGLICQDFMSGEMLWNEKGKGFSKGAVRIADGMIYTLDEREGIVSLVEASPKGFDKKGSFELPAETKLREGTSGLIWSHPVVVGGKLYLRDCDLIWCYDVKG